MAQVQLLNLGAVLEQSTELIAALVIDLVLEELQDPQVRALLAKLHHLLQPFVVEPTLRKVDLRIVLDT